MTIAAGAGPGEARAYHDATRHSWASVREHPRFLDWRTRPSPFKLYPEAPVVALPREVPSPALPALDALRDGAAIDQPRAVDLSRLAAALFLSAGITRTRTLPNGDTLHFRAAASTGALYEVETYVVAGAIPGLDAGVYHFGPDDFALHRLRAADHRGTLAAAASAPDRVRAAPVTIVLSALYWRNTWKYRARAYRHFFWDAGTLLANLLATATALSLPASVLVGFADGPVNDLLGLDVRHEGALALVPLGARGEPPPPALALAPLALRTAPPSSREVDEPLVRQAYLASALPDGAAARAWADLAPAGPGPGRPGGPAGDGPGGGLAAWPPAGGAAPPAGASLGETIRRRGSTRRFARVAIEAAALRTILETAVRPLPLDTTAALTIDVYVLVHAVTGIDPGAYVYAPATASLRLLRAGEFRDDGGYLCLEQPLGADASAVVFFLADLQAALARAGSRAYRAVNLAAGLLGGRLYLAAYALGLGASGLTFYDDDVARFFSPDALGKEAIFVTALGRAHRPPAVRARPTGAR